MISELHIFDFLIEERFWNHVEENIYFFAKENLFSENEDTIYIDIVGDPIFNIYDDVVMEEKDAHVQNSICDDDENSFIKIARMSDGHVVAVWEDGFTTTKNLHVISTKEDVKYVFNSTRSQSDVFPWSFGVKKEVSCKLWKFWLKAIHVLLFVWR